MASYMVEPDIPEEDIEADDDENVPESSAAKIREQLNDIDTGIILFWHSYTHFKIDYCRCVCRDISHPN